MLHVGRWATSKWEVARLPPIIPASLNFKDIYLSILHSNTVDNSYGDITPKGELHAVIWVLELILCIVGGLLGEFNSTELVPMKLCNAQSHCIQPKGPHEALNGVLIAEMVETLGPTRRQPADEKWEVADFRLSPLVKGLLRDQTLD
jgi:hypothetical protein